MHLTSIHTALTSALYTAPASLAGVWHGRAATAAQESLDDLHAQIAAAVSMLEHCEQELRAAGLE